MSPTFLWPRATPVILGWFAGRTWENNSNLYTCENFIVQGDTKKRELLKNPTKIEEIQEKKLLTEIEPLKLAF